MQQGKIVKVSPTIALNAAKNSIDLRLLMADSIIFSTVQALNVTLWTQDSNLENLSGVNLVRKKQ